MSDDLNQPLSERYPSEQYPRKQYQGTLWVQIDEVPRIIADSLRRYLQDHGLVSVLRTPFQWVEHSPVIEIETSGYQGSVAIYVPEVMLEEALHLLQGDEK